MRENIVFIVGILKDLAPLLISFIAIWLTGRYQNHTKKLASDKLMKELFSEFNVRYDEINNNLDVISKISIQQWADLSEEERTLWYGDVIDFFNICAEEYYWHKEGRINGNIWKSWSKGMNDIYNRSQVIQSIWEDECKNEGYKSYYIDKPNEFFKRKNSSDKLNKAI